MIHFIRISAVHLRSLTIFIQNHHQSEKFLPAISTGIDMVLNQLHATLQSGIVKPILRKFPNVPQAFPAYQFVGTSARNVFQKNPYPVVA